MKKFITCLALAVTYATASAQNWSVWFYGAGNAQGFPAFWPSGTQPIGTNTSITAPAVLMTTAALVDCVNTNTAAYNGVISNQNFTATATINVNLAALVSSYSNLNFVAQNWASITNLATAKFAIQAEGEVLLKLKPLLQQMYNGQ